MKKIILSILAIAVIVICYFTFWHKSESITPVEFPKDLGIQNFNFPEDSNVVNKWLETQDTASITNHAWGIWAGLTQPTEQTYNGQTLLVFETWMGVQELAALSAQGQVSNSATKLNRTNLNTPKQFGHAHLFTTGQKLIDTNFQVLETVCYDPSAAFFSTSNQVFNLSVINKYTVKDGIGSIPEFPNTAITCKPTYYTGKADKNGLIRVPVWVSPDPAKAFRYNEWTTFVYADINNKQEKNKKIVPVTSSNPTQEQIDAATCNVNDFINYKIDRTGAAYLNSHQDVGTTPSRQFIEGDYVLLVAMHVTTKEIKNWTWQTYFWCPDASNPPSPSSKFEASLRPKELKGAASHYAVSVAYAMVWPNQPITGGSDKGTRPIIAFNPYLEGGFGPQVFALKNNFKPEFKYGMQTNCMSCHATAAMTNDNRYCTDMYIDMMDTSLFKNKVKLDFAWSIQGNVNLDK
jgi:hypothetical protein